MFANPVSDWISCTNVIAALVPDFSALYSNKKMDAHPISDWLSRADEKEGMVLYDPWRRYRNRKAHSHLCKTIQINIELYT